MRNSRNPSVDLARGFAVICMIALHAFDAFADTATRSSAYGQATWFFGGGAAPLFVMLAGLATALAMQLPGKRDMMIRRGVEIFSLALLFRVQEWALGGAGSASRMMLRVDVLNCLGVSIVLVALVRHVIPRYEALLAIGIIWIAATPLFATGDVVPPPLGYYFGGPADLALFPLFPWTGYAFIGAAYGTYAAGDDELLVKGGLWAALAYVVILTVRLIWPQEIHFARTNVNFVFTLERCTAALGVVAFAQWLPLKKQLTALGQRSLLVYWVHVDLCYGLLFHRFKRTMSASETFMTTAALVIFCYFLCVARARLKPARKEDPCPSNALSPS